jgi:hypothetical protein
MRRYRTIEALNTAWYRQFSSWDTVPAPKFISLMTYTEYIDWIHFIQEKLAEDLTWRQNCIRQADQHITTSHSAVPMVLTNPLDEPTIGRWRGRSRSGGLRFTRGMSARRKLSTPFSGLPCSPQHVRRVIPSVRPIG